jgi:serine/threonine protein kinase/Tol biopolymer transport system component
MLNTTLAHYKITAKLGAGGMGEVYRATDTKLGREVAIKVLPDEFASSKERLARFEREAKALAQLNHPHIAAVHGFDQSDGQWFLAMELIEGEDLSTCLKRGAMPVEEALEVCKQIAEALEAAHEKGIIHRDLKPGNVKLTEDGQVKVLDFGLAKTAEACSEGSSNADSMSPTITADYTMPGTLLGTAAYMSPEQARGKPVDKRSDIWSFGCVLYECLTGKRMFQSEDTTETLATIIKGEPDWSALPENTPPTVHLLLRKCLAKDRKRRLPDIAAARIDLEEAIADPSSSFIRLSDQALQETGKRNGIKPLLSIGVVAGCVLTAILTWSLKPDPPLPVHEPAPVRVLNVDLGMEDILGEVKLPAKLSPDGSVLAYRTTLEGFKGHNLYLQRLDQLEPEELVGGGRVWQFCFSPESDWIAYLDGGTLKKVSVDSGAVITLSGLVKSMGMLVGLDWSDPDWITFGTLHSGLHRVSASPSETPEPLTTLLDKESIHCYPQALPGSQAILYTAYGKNSDIEEANIMAQRLGDAEPKLVLQRGYSARYLRSGHLVFMRQGALYAVAFDLETLTPNGQESLVIAEVASNKPSGAFFNVSSDGTLVYTRGPSDFGGRESLYTLDWLDRNGKREVLMSADTYRSFNLSPKGDFLAYGLEDDEGQHDIWFYNIERGIPRQLTYDPADDVGPVWSPSGESIVFRSFRDRDEGSGMYWKRTDSVFDESQKLQTDSENSQHPVSWHREGHLSVTEFESGGDIRIVNLEGDDSAGWAVMDTTDFLVTRFDERQGSFSPNGDWMAYFLKESRQTQVFVRSFPGRDGEVRISIGNSASRRPRWLETTKELIFSSDISDSREKQIFSVKYRVEDGEFLPEEPVPWEGGNISSEYRSNNYDVDPNSDRLLVRSLVEADEPEQTFDHVVVFDNFFEHVRKTLSTNEK